MRAFSIASAMSRSLAQENEVQHNTLSVSTEEVKIQCGT